MEIIKETTKNHKVSFVVKVSKTIWDNAKSKAFNKMAVTVKVPGFRQGKAPQDIIKKHVNEIEVMQNAANDAIRQTYDELIKSNKINKENIIEDALSINIIKLDPNDFEVEFNFDEYPKVELGNYKSLKVEYKNPTVSDEEINNELSRITKRDSMLIEKQDDILEKNDMAIFDFKGFIDEKEFPGGSANDYELVIGSNQFIPGFEDAMVGMKKGESKIISVSFPKDYHVKEMAGKPAKFEVKLNDIKQVKSPELTEEYIAKFKLPEVKNELQLREFLKKQLFDFKELNAKQEATKSISEQIMKITKIDFIPESLLASEIERLNNELNHELESKKLSIDNLLKQRKISKEEFEKETKEAARKNLMLVLAIEKMIKELNIKVSSDEIDDHLKKIAEVYGQKFEEIKSQMNGNFEGVKQFLLQKKLFDKLIEINSK